MDSERQTLQPPPPSFARIWRIVRIVVLIFVGAYALYIFLTGRSRSEQAPIPQAQLSGRAHAKTLLSRARSKQIELFKEQNRYSDDPALVFADVLGEKDPFSYVFGVIPACAGAVSNFPSKTLISQQRARLDENAAKSITVIERELLTIKLPCKPAGAGFTLIAVGNLDADNDLDVVTLDESRTIKILRKD